MTHALISDHHVAIESLCSLGEVVKFEDASRSVPNDLAAQDSRAGELIFEHLVLLLHLRKGVSLLGSGGHAVLAAFTLLAKSSMPQAESHVFSSFTCNSHLHHVTLNMLKRHKTAK